MKHGINWYRRPELIFAEMVKKTARHDDEPTGRHYQRAVVLAIDVEGGLLENTGGAGGLTSVGLDGKSRTFAASVGPPNPPSSVKARVLTDGYDRLLTDEDVRVFWPMFPQDQVALPVAPGEHVYVVFEGRGNEHGLWLSRVSGHDSANAFRGTDSYTAPTNPPSAMDSFEPNPVDYDTTDEKAGLAPPVNAMTFFDEGDG